MYQSVSPSIVTNHQSMVVHEKPTRWDRLQGTEGGHACPGLRTKEGVVRWCGAHDWLVNRIDIWLVWFFGRFWLPSWFISSWFIMHELKLACLKFRIQFGWLWRFLMKMTQNLWRGEESPILRWAQEEIQKMISDVDDDGSGTIGYEELLGFHRFPTPLDPLRRLIPNSQIIHDSDSLGFLGMGWTHQSALNLSRYSNTIRFNSHRSIR